ncbi:MAG TPA: tetratricopeptide repeat protein [Rubricoccaceae bacterium]|nr:tetratricopeptide repeat protein [Rubricoccaceae bacterium]
MPSSAPPARRSRRASPPSSPLRAAPDDRGRLWGVVVVVAAVLAFANAVGGAFVYDDTRQIAANPLIQDPGRLGEALASDVWAFRAEMGEAGSNYWRPAFVLWLVLNHGLFGLDPVGWHLTNLLLHGLVTALAFGFLRRLRLDVRVAASIALLFAVHPVHVESVAWVSGSPDLLLGVGVLGALWAVLGALERPRWWRWAAAGGAGVLAVTSKEVGVVLPVLVAATVAAAAPERHPGQSILLRAGARWRKPLLIAAPFAVLAAGYFLLRWAVIGRFAQEAPWQHGPVEALLTAPGLLAFYLRQIVLPLWLGPVYPLRPVTLDGLGATSFWVPLFVAVGAGAGALWMARKGATQKIGLAMFVLPLLPALNIPAFPPEHLAHDRYLYLPLLGALMLVVPTAAEALARGRRGTEGAAKATLAGAAVLAALLLLQTVRYNLAWTSEMALWARAVETDPGSASSWSQYAIALRESGRTREAAEAIDRSLAIRPMAPALIERADLLATQGRAAEAARDLQAVLAMQPDNHLPYERLAVLYQQSGQLREAEATLRAGRTANPEQACAFSANLGVVLYLQGRKAEAQSELERVGPLAGRDLNPACRVGLYHLGALYAEQGDAARARATWRRFLALTATIEDERTRQLRALAQQQLAGPG